MSSQYRQTKYCKYPFCETTFNRLMRKSFGYNKKKFYQFPKDSRLTKWKEVCNIHPNVKCTHFYICEDHFLPSDFKPNSQKKLNSKAIPKERTMPEEIKEHNYAVSPTDVISTEQSHAKKSEKNTKLYINWATASIDDKINFLNSFFENQENFMYAKTNSHFEATTIENIEKQDETSSNSICYINQNDSNFIDPEQSKIQVETMESPKEIKDDCIHSYNSLNIDCMANEQSFIDNKSSQEKTWNIPNSLTGLTNANVPLISLLPVQVALPPSVCNMDISDYSPFINKTPEKNNSELPFQIKSVYSLSEKKSRETPTKYQKIRECKFPSCNSFSRFIKSKSKKFFHFPTKASTLKVWKKVCGIDTSIDCSNFYICEDHFSLADFNDFRHPIKLHIDAIPRPLSKFKQHEHNYADRTPCLLNDHNYALNLNE